MVKGLRLDKWMWFARFIKSRSLAAKFCQASRIKVNGCLVSKAHHMVHLDDVLTFLTDSNVRVIKIVCLGARRGPARVAQDLYEDLAPPVYIKKEDREPRINAGKREIGSGRPTKSERRAIDKLMAKED